MIETHQFIERKRAILALQHVNVCHEHTCTWKKQKKTNLNEAGQYFYLFYLQNIEGVWLVDKTVFEFCFAENSLVC
jgi:hypothetical protein